MTSSRSAYDMLRLPPGSNTSKAAPEAAGFRLMRDGRELTPSELPLEQSVASGRKFATRKCPSYLRTVRRSTCWETRCHYSTAKEKYAARWERSWT